MQMRTVRPQWKLLRRSGYLPRMEARPANADVDPRLQWSESGLLRRFGAELLGKEPKYLLEGLLQPLPKHVQHLQLGIVSH